MVLVLSTAPPRPNVGKVSNRARLYQLTPSSVKSQLPDDWSQSKYFAVVAVVQQLTGVPRFRSLTPTPNLPVEKTVTAQQRHVSAPLPSSPAILANPPPRSASLGRVLNSTQLPSPPPSATKSTHLTLEKVVVDKSMSRNKTRSKVWGIFKSKKGKRGDGKETETVAQRKRDDHFAKGEKCVP